jgi:tetratricopeptide (TPR) repeat protein
MHSLQNQTKLFLLAYFVICSCVFLAYFNTLNNPFIWDDESLVVRNPLIKKWDFLSKVFISDLYYGTTTGSNFYRPMQTLSYMGDYHFWQSDPRGYHLTNILLQTLVSFLVFLFAYLLLGNFSVCLAAGLLFAVCPIHTEVVGYISGRADMLMALFLLSSFLLFAKSQSSTSARQRFFFLLSVASFVLALLSKELALVFPLAIFSYVYYFSRDRQGHAAKSIKTVSPFFLASIAYVILRLSWLKFATLRPPALAKYPLLLRITVLPKVILTYLKLLILPVDLHMSWELIRPTTFFGFYVAWFSLGVLVVASAYLLRYAPKRKTTSFLLFWSLLFFLPQSGIYAINALVAEHFIYLSSISFFIALAILLHKCLRKKLFIFSLACLTAFYGSLTASRNFEWSDPVSFFKGILKFSPASFQAHNNLGLQFEYRHLYDEAIHEYLKALEIMPDLLEARSNLANLYFKMGRFEEAKREYALVEKAAPESKAGGIQNNIGNIYDAEGLMEEALERYRRALALDPSLNFSYFNIARIHFLKGRLEEASIQVLKSLPEVPVPKEEKPGYLKLIERVLTSGKKYGNAAPFYNDLGVMFAQAGFFEAAVAAFQRVLELDPKNPDTHFNLGLAYWKKGLMNKATWEFKYCLKLNPGHYQAKGMLSEIQKSAILSRIFH